ncbi:GHKL domain-containing protein [Cetobacterium sp.]|uniref:GHKL domain-containing protein n=1 Tax=Cetobacterium sp. TaxID=2071632 RepID=UPI003F322A85
MKLEIFKMKENLYITVKNTINCKIKQEDGKYKTTKQGGKGIGLRQIDKIVKSYKGSIIRKIEDNIFITKILIPL